MDGEGNPRERPDTTRLPELLAPAGSPESFRAAVAAGADAVYLGGKRFGARAFAGNFTDAGIKEAVTYAHERGVKVYVTVNTLIHDRELKEAMEFLLSLYASGADAVLVQDIGLASLAREIVPDLPLHASTQMTIHSAEGVRFAAGMGFSRVVLARELTLDEIGAIARDTAGKGVGLEVFAHGALCFSYSGMCLLSSVIGGRSGNRGMCAQPCRKPYELVRGTTDEYGRLKETRTIPQDGDYLLSPKDLCTYPALDRLVKAPVVSLKIEGRMKSPEYVALVVAAYRRALDAIAAGRPFANDTDTDNLALAFNRSFTTGYLFGKRHSAVMGRERPDNRGLLIGTVEQYLPENREALIRPFSGRPLAAGDGLFIRDPDRPEEGIGFPLNTAPVTEKGRIRVPLSRQVKPGSMVFLTSSAASAAQARRIMAGDDRDLLHPVPIDCTVTADDDGSVTMSGTIEAGDGRQIPVTLHFPHMLAPAKTRPVTAGDLETRLQKTGETPFAFRTLNIACSGTMFAPAAELNRMRREFLARAGEALVASSCPSKDAVAAARERLARVCRSANPEMLHVGGAPGHKKATLIAITDSVEGVRAATEAGCGSVCFEPFFRVGKQACRHRAGPGTIEEQLQAAAAVCRQASVPLIWKLPRVTHQDELGMIAALLPGLRSEGLNACMAESCGAAAVVRQCCPEIPVFGGYGLNVFNYKTAVVLADTFAELTLSPELSGPEIAQLISSARATGCTVPFALTVQGSTEAVMAENCLCEPVFRCREQDTGPAGGFLGIRDSTGRIFRVTVDGSCRTHIFNADETCLIDHLPEILAAGVTSLLVDARGRTMAGTGKIVSAYREAILAVQENRPSVKQDLSALKRQIREIALQGITAGPFLRGLRES